MRLMLVIQVGMMTMAVMLMWTRESPLISMQLMKVGFYAKRVVTKVMMLTVKVIARGEN